ncbi:MAG: ribonuclease HII [Steroidobacteraceae bacterium]
MLVAGVDDAGRGPLAGPVVAAAVILDPQRPIAGLGDSKALSPARREVLEPVIFAQALAYGVGLAQPEEIDRLNILQATLLAMRRALEALATLPELVRVDGNRCPDLTGSRIGCPVTAEVRGDARFEEIMAASILAKVHRDRLMVEAAGHHPGYGFEVHKGYPTPAHLRALDQLGPSPLHRMSFGPVKSRA